MYGQAWKLHTGALKGANARRQIMAELMMGATLGFVTGGVGGAMSKSSPGAWARTATERRRR